MVDLSHMDTLLFYRRLFRDCIRHTADRRVKLLLLADLRLVQRAIAGDVAAVTEFTVRYVRS
jgi:hypothetical protein